MKHRKVDVKYAGQFVPHRDNSINYINVPLSDLSVGINFTDNHIIKISQQHQVEWITSRICDHANGTLQSCNDKSIAECPLHGWKLDLETLTYTNVSVKKEQIPFTTDGNNLQIEHQNLSLELPEDISSNQSSAPLEIRFLAHASLEFICGDIKIITDPWLQGPCFLNAWWHSPTPADDVIEKLLSADVIYISHNHPDHFHLETLQILFKHNPDILIITPNFQSKSAELPIRSIGFTNVRPLPFNQLFRIDSDVVISILKSGDFRDDSGLFIGYGKKQALITVDASTLNQLILPKDIDFLATSFAEGASGYPWCFDDYSEAKKTDIMNVRNNASKQWILDYIAATEPSAYMPYAGYFTESAPRDSYMKLNNKKVTRSEVKDWIKSYDANITFIDPLLSDKIVIGETITFHSEGKGKLEEETKDTVERYIQSEKKASIELLKKLVPDYFINSKFKDQLKVYLLLCDDDFKEVGPYFIIDFSVSPPTCKHIDSLQEILNCYQHATSSERNLLIRVRINLFSDVIENYKSWEELSIGFHCRIHRKPDIYNSDFWYHFSNIYIHQFDA